MLLFFWVVKQKFPISGNIRLFCYGEKKNDICWINAHYEIKYATDCNINPFFLCFQTSYRFPTLEILSSNLDICLYLPNFLGVLPGQGTTTHTKGKNMAIINSHIRHTAHFRDWRTVKLPADSDRWKQLSFLSEIWENFQESYASFH